MQSRAMHADSCSEASIQLGAWLPWLADGERSAFSLEEDADAQMAAEGTAMPKRKAPGAKKAVSKAPRKKAVASKKKPAAGAKACTLKR